jgi:hypothetical protein
MTLEETNCGDHRALRNRRNLSGEQQTALQIECGWDLAQRPTTSDPRPKIEPLGSERPDLGIDSAD